MDSALPATLAKLIARRGEPLLDDPRLLNAILRDLHPDAPLQVSVLIEVLRSGQLTALRDASLPRVTADATIVTHLKEQSGVAPRHSAWAIDVWREVLMTPSLEAAQPTPRQGPMAYSLISERKGSLAEVLLGTQPTNPNPSRT